MIRAALVIVTAIYLQTAHGLQCYQCMNVEIEEGSTGIFAGLAGKSDPSCGINPSKSVTCAQGMNVCGTLNGYLTVTTIFGNGKAKVQVRDCMKDDSGKFAHCIRDDTANSLVSALLNFFVHIPGTHAEVKGEVCTCKMDYCLACDGGLEVAGTCVKYWMIGLLAGGVLLLFILCVTCCCCCCCKKGNRGRVLSTGPSYQILTVTPTHTVGSLSVQSGDLVGYDNPLITGAPPMGVASGQPTGYYYPNDPTMVGVNEPANRPHVITLA